MRSRLCRVCSEFHPLEEWPQACAGHFGDRVQATNVRPDGMDAIRSMADGKMYDSRSGYYASVKRAGCEIVGNDRYVGKPDLSVFSNVGRDMKIAIEQLKARS
jgi:hypothetical protein